MYAKQLANTIHIALPYRNEEEFLQRELELLGRSGSFLPGVDLARGTVVSFELMLPNGISVIRGEGRVLGHVASRKGKPGAVIRFTRLEPGSRDLVEHAANLLAARRAGGTTMTDDPSTTASPVAAQWLSEESAKEVERTVSSATTAPPSASTTTAPSRASTITAQQSVVGKPAARTFQKPSQEERMEESRSNGLYLVAGSKGGVGKSMVTMALVDLLREQGKQVFLVECDDSNPDVWKAHKDEMRSELVDLDEGEGWIRLLNICDANREHVIVVNTAARNNIAVTRFGSTLNDSLDELGRELVTFWVINRQRDSLELLTEFMSAIPRSVLHVVRNGYFGEERKFELYNTSTTRETIESKGGKSITFAELADRVADDLYSKHLSIGTATKTLPLGNRAELSRWRGEVKKGFSGLLNGRQL